MRHLLFCGDGCFVCLHTPLTRAGHKRFVCLGTRAFVEEKKKQSFAGEVCGKAVSSFNCYVNEVIYLLAFFGIFIYVLFAYKNAFQLTECV